MVMPELKREGTRMKSKRCTTVVFGIILACAATSAVPADEPLKFVQRTAATEFIGEFPRTIWLRYLRTELVATELELTTEQRNEVARAKAAVEAAIIKVAKVYPQLSQEDRLARRCSQRVQDEAAPALLRLEKSLTASQIERLGQIAFQSSQTGIFDWPNVGRGLRLTPEQTTAIEQLRSDQEVALNRLLKDLELEAMHQVVTEAEMQQIHQAGFDTSNMWLESEAKRRSDVFDQTAAVLDELCLREFEELLTAAQRERLEEFRGNPIDVVQLKGQIAFFTMSVQSPEGADPPWSESSTF